MGSYSIQHIAQITGGKILHSADANAVVEELCTDSRRIIHPSSALFFALQTQFRNGHAYLVECYQKGVRNFVVHQQVDSSTFKDANIILVENSLTALQKLSAFHRSQFQIPVIGITGSNGKTIVKEWLHQLLHQDYNIVRSPKSYNSQVGVPLSVWAMNNEHTLAIFEAGISQTGEMQQLQQIIAPTIGIFTNLGEAHQQGFTSKEEKLKEKLKLFQQSATIICSPDRILGIENFVTNKELITWGAGANNTLQAVEIKKGLYETTLYLQWKQILSFEITIPFTDDASVDNALTCICTCLHIGTTAEQLQKRCLQLRPINLRLEIKKGLHNTTIINDSYSADLSSFEIALNLLLQQQQHPSKSMIISDFAETSAGVENTYQSIASFIQTHKIDKVISVGEQSRQYLPAYLTNIQLHSFSNVNELIDQLPVLHFKDEAILIKGARKFELERLMPLLEQKVHQTVLEVNLTAIAKNIKTIRQQILPATKLMVVVKAFSYGSGSYEIANLLQYHGADYLAVAFTDEGVELRKCGITLPIMVMNPEPVSFDVLTEHNLEPEIFSFQLLNQFETYLEQEGITNYPVHIKIDTGMHRLGFMPYEVEELCNQLNAKKYCSIQSVFSHLASSEDESDDAFTMQQAQIFDKACAAIQQSTGQHFMKHLSNTSGIIRHHQLQYDMVRLGIGMYGITSNTNHLLEEVLVLKTTIAQIKQLLPGDTVGYNRRGKITRPSVIAVTRIGYADGYPRNLSNGIGSMLVKGQPAPVIGTVCMDMTMLDITDIPNVQEGDEVIVFGRGISVNELAIKSNTIPYEILTGINQRVKRVYYEE
jgi:Alr-MurF fusion protein